MEPAVIAVLGAIVGVLLTNGIKLVIDLRDRAERIRDIQTALRAEMRSQRRSLESFNSEDQWEATLAQIANGAYTPLAPRKADPFLFNAIAGDVHILPSEVIDPIVLYYGQYANVQTFVDEIRSAQYGALPADRRVRMFGDYLALGLDTLRLADGAISAIDASLGEQREAQ